MKTEQKHTPKYWIGHNTQTDEVYLETASKSLKGATEKLECALDKVDNILRNACVCRDNYSVALFEIKFVQH